MANNKWYVVTDKDDPGSEHTSWEEAAEVVSGLQKNGHPDARIIGPGCDSDPWRLRGE